MPKSLITKLLAIISVLAFALFLLASCYIAAGPPPARIVTYEHLPSTAFKNHADFEDPAFAAFRDGNIRFRMLFYTSTKPKKWTASFAPMSLEKGQTIYVKSADLRYLGKVRHKEFEQSYALDTANMRDMYGHRIYRADVKLFDDIELTDTDNRNSKLWIDVTYEKDGEVKTITFEITNTSYYIDGRYL